MRVCDFIADFLYKQGVSHVFMMSGGGSIYLDDGITCHKHLKYIGVRNEATAPMMAEAYARITQNIGAVYVTTGPGGTNAVAGLAEAWVDSAPVIIISGQVEREHTTYNSKLKGLRTLGCQEINIIDVVKSMTKYSIMINDPNSIKYHLEKAVFLAKSGRPGPVWLDIPLDVQSSVIKEQELYGFVPDDCSVNIPVNLIDKVVEELLKSKKPIFIIGQGVRQSGAIEELNNVVNKLKIPVVSSRLGQDILSFSNKYYFGHGGIKGHPVAAYVMKNADLIISVGSRLSIPFVGMNLDAFSKDAKIIAVDIEKIELLKNGVHIDIPIHGDAKKFLFELNRKLHFLNVDSVSEEFLKWVNNCDSEKKNNFLNNFQKKSNPIDLYYFASRLDALSTEKNIFVSSAGSSYFVSGQSLKFDKGQREITSGTFASMGLGIPLSIGSAVANPNAQVLAIVGDGCLELNIQELKTLSQYNLNVKLFVINNGGYVSIRNTQDKLFEGRYINSDQVGNNEILDFSKVASTFGLKYFLIDDYNNIDNMIKNVMSDDYPAFIEVVCDNKQKIINCY